ncbi:MAG: hypothetical protein ACE5ES_03630 [Candidatus Nanoarchaeia archaeon]
MSSGNDLTCGIPPKYGVYFAEEAEEDILTAQRNAGIYSAIGGGFIPTADIEFYVRPIKIGYLVRRQHGDEFRDRKVVGFGLSLKGVDRVAYREAHKTATNLSERLGLSLIDQTSQDLASFSEYEEQLRLEERVHNYKARVGV